MTDSALEQRIFGNLRALEARIAAACRKVGRDPSEVRLLPVSKTFEPAAVRAAWAAGYRRFGENKVQEAQEKAGVLDDLPIEWCIIGHLQTNKARHVARFAAEVHSLDSVRLAAELDRRLQAEGRSVKVLVQVNTSGESNKSGLAPDQVPGLLAELPAFHSLQVRGFMTIAMDSDDAAAVRACFRQLRTIREQARQDAPSGLVFDELSMGMSGDFELAIEEGATMVRLGTAVFGARF